MPRKITTIKPWKKRVVISSSSSSTEEEEEENVPMQEDTGFDPTLFVSLKASNQYKHLVSLKILTGSRVVFDELEEYNLRPLFDFQGWMPFLTLSCKTYARLVREFYSNLGCKEEEPTHLTSMVDGNDVIVTPEILAYTLHVPNVGVDIYDLDLESFTSYPRGKNIRHAARLLHGAGNENMYDDLVMNNLLDRPRVLVNLLSHTVIPKTGSRHKYSGTHKLLAYCILAGIQVNLPILLIKYMWHISGGGTNLYYGKVLTRLFEECDIDLTSQTDIVKEDVAFGSRNINLMKSRGSLPSQSSRGESSRQQRSSSRPTSSQPESDFQSQVFQRFDDLKVQNETLRTQTDYSFNYLHGQIDYNFNYLYSNLHFDPPPPYQYVAPSTSGHGQQGEEGNDDDNDEDDDDEEE